MSATRAVAAVTGTVTAAAMIATPLVPRGGSERRALSSAVVVSLAATTAANAGARWGTARALTALGAVGVTTTVIERIGTATGVPFGRYEYTGALRPQIGRSARDRAAGLVRHGGSRPRGRTRGRRSTVRGGDRAWSSVPSRLTAWDLFLDPQMVGEGYWLWARRGRLSRHPARQLRRMVRHRTRRDDHHRTGVAGRGFLRHRRRRWTRQSPDAALVATYGLVGLMETIGFARYFRDPVVATVGGLGMLPLAAVALVRRTRARGITT